MSLALATEGIIARRVIEGDSIGDAVLKYGKIYFRGEELKPEIKVTLISDMKIKEE